MVVVEPEGRVHAHVAVALVDVVEGEETGAHETRAGQQVLRVGLNLENIKLISLLSKFVNVLVVVQLICRPMMTEISSTTTVKTPNLRICSTLCYQDLKIQSADIGWPTGNKVCIKSPWTVV